MRRRSGELMGVGGRLGLLRQLILCAGLASRLVCARQRGLVVARPQEKEVGSTELLKSRFKMRQSIQMSSAGRERR